MTSFVGLEATVVRVFFTRLGDNSDNSERSVFCWLEAMEVVPCMELEFWHFRPQRLTF